MKKILCALLAFALAFALSLDCALAKRLGGGTSFGSKPSYSRSYTPPASTPYNPSSPSQSGQVAPAPASPMGQPQGPGLFSRLGWGMGGFFAGGLLGSMLFGHGGGWGGGGGIGLLDILLVGLIVYFGFRLLRGRGSAEAPGPRNIDPRDLRPDPRSRAEQSWDSLRSQLQQQPAAPAGTNSTGGFGVASGTEPLPEPAVPPGFSIPDFLEGAKTVYARLQHSWDRRDLNDIALFTTPDVLTEIKRQAAADPTPSKTELLLVNARLLEFREEEADTVATVLFDVLMREDASEDRPKQIREVWHFSRPTGNIEANWRLEGIQQLEA
jgi:Uncharacterized protein conserved in bacteria